MAIIRVEPGDGTEVFIVETSPHTWIINSRFRLPQSSGMAAWPKDHNPTIPVTAEIAGVTVHTPAMPLLDGWAGRVFGSSAEAVEFVMKSVATQS